MHGAEILRRRSAAGYGFAGAQELLLHGVEIRGPFPRPAATGSGHLQASVTSPSPSPDLPQPSLRFSLPSPPTCPISGFQPSISPLRPRPLISLQPSQDLPRKKAPAPLRYASLWEKKVYAVGSICSPFPAAGKTTSRCNQLQPACLPQSCLCFNLFWNIGFYLIKFNFPQWSTIVVDQLTFVKSI